MDFTIRKAEPRDLEAVNDLLRQVLAIHHEGRPDLFNQRGKKYTDAELLEIFANPDTPVFVYDRGETLLGYAFCELRHSSSGSLRPVTTLYIDDLCVQEHARGMHIGKALFEQVGAVRIPPNKLALVNRFKRALMLNGGDYDKTISMEEFAPYEKDIVEVMEKIVDISLDAPIGDDAGSSADSVSTLMDVLGSDGNQDDDMEKEERKKLIQETLASLPRREEEILRMFYGLDTVEDTTLKDIGEDLRLSRERVRQIKNKTLRRLQKSKEHKEKLSDFLEL